MHQQRSTGLRQGALAYRWLRDQILSGRLQPGERLDPAGLANELCVSITPVRDAIKLLASQGLVTVLPRSQTMVSAFGTNDIREMLQLREILEAGAGQIATLSLSVDEIDELMKAASALETDRGPGAGQDVSSYLEYVGADIEFHTSIVRGARNAHLEAAYVGLQWQLVVARAAFPATFRSRPHRQGEHRAIVEAIGRRDPVLASRAIIGHIRNSAQDLVAVLAEQP